MKFFYRLVCIFLSSSISAYAADISQVLNQALPTLPDHQEVTMVSVTYKPGESTPLHQHHAHTYVYVLEGAVNMQVQGGEEKTLHVGDTFYESPEDIHVVSENASTTHPAKIMVFFIKTINAPATVMLNQ